MEYIEGGDLSKYIAEEVPKPISEVKEIATQILEGLKTLHSLSIYHRDLKPQNILMACLDPIWVKITDFGVSKEEKTLIPKPNKKRGEKKYGHPAYALDMWSLGILLHEVVTGMTPFCKRETDADPESDADSEISDSDDDYVTAFAGMYSVDESFLGRYCKGEVEFPTDLLATSRLDEEGAGFLKAILVAAPKGRLNPVCALESPWLEGYQCSEIESLKREFLLLGLDPDLVDGKEPRKERLAQIFSHSAMQSVSFLFTKAAENGYNLAIKRFFDLDILGLIDSHTIKESLRLAIVHRQLKAVRMILQKTGIEYRGDMAEKIFRWGVDAGCAHVLEMLQPSGALDISTLHREKMFLPVLRSKNFDILKIVIEKGNLNNVAYNTERLPAIAAESGNTRAVELLLDNNVNAEALRLAVQGGHSDVVKLLLERGAEVGSYFLREAARGGHLDIVKLLRERRGAKADSGCLRKAAHGGHLDVVESLLEGTPKQTAIPTRRSFL